MNSKLRHFIKLTILEISFKCLYSIQNRNSHLIPSKPFQPLFYLKYDFLSFIAIHNCQAKIGFFHTKNIKFKTKCIAHSNGNSFLWIDCFGFESNIITYLRRRGSCSEGPFSSAHQLTQCHKEINLLNNSKLYWQPHST